MQKYDISSSPRAGAKNFYSIAEVMPDNTIRYFRCQKDMRKGDDVYEGKLLTADMIQEKGQTKELFSVNRNSIHIIEK